MSRQPDHAAPFAAGGLTARLALGWAALALLGEALIRSPARAWGVVALLDLFHPWWYAPGLPLGLAALLGVPFGPRWRTLALICGCGAIWLAAYGGRWFPPSRGMAEPPAFRIMTWNVAGWNIDDADLDRAISKERPDIVVLQEVDQALAAPLHARLDARYPYSYIRQPTAPGRQPADLALWSRYPYAASPLDCPYWDCYRHAVELTLPAGPLTLINVHIEHSPPITVGGVPIGLRREREDAAIDRLLADTVGWSPLGNGRLLLAGDFNTVERQAAYARLAARWADSWREGGFGLGATWPRTALTPPLLRIDYVWHGAGLAVRGAALGSGRSDHRYLVVDLAWR